MSSHPPANVLTSAGGVTLAIDTDGRLTGSADIAGANTSEPDGLWVPGGLGVGAGTQISRVAALSVQQWTLVAHDTTVRDDLGWAVLGTGVAVKNTAQTARLYVVVAQASFTIAASQSQTLGTAAVINGATPDEARFVTATWQGATVPYRVAAAVAYFGRGPMAIAKTVGSENAAATVTEGVVLNGVLRVEPGVTATIWQLALANGTARNTAVPTSLSVVMLRDD